MSTPEWKTCQAHNKRYNSSKYSGCYSCHKERIANDKVVAPNGTIVDWDDEDAYMEDKKYGRLW